PPSSFTSSCHARTLLSFPTRRSSDLYDLARARQPVGIRNLRLLDEVDLVATDLLAQHFAVDDRHEVAALHPHKLEAAILRIVDRSEEHTSELQSRENLVCRLLLETKK